MLANLSEVQINLGLGLRYVIFLQIIDLTSVYSLLLTDRMNF